MSSDEQSDKECPLCMEAFDEDINFFPCNCQYQICRFCWHRLRTDDTGLCPGCRQPFPEDPVNFQPLSSEQIKKIKIGKKQKFQQQKLKTSECRKHLSAYRVLQKNLVYVVGLSQRMADADLLKKAEFFGKFGKISKIAVGAVHNVNGPNTFQPTFYTAYITYVRTDDALKAIQAVNNLLVDGRLLKASLGTTKYCSSFLKGQSCHKQDCMYLHQLADEELSFTKEDMHVGKHIELERRLHDRMEANQPQPANLNGCSVNEVSRVRNRNCRPQIERSNEPSAEVKRNQGQRHSHRDASMPPVESFNFFLDLYDDQGFDPFSKSSNASTELLQEEEKTFSARQL